MRQLRRRSRGRAERRTLPPDALPTPGGAISEASSGYNHVLLIGGLEPVRSAIPAEYSVTASETWADAVPMLREFPLARRAFLNARLVEPRGVRLLEGLHARGHHVPLTIYLPKPTTRLFARAWLARRVAQNLVHPPDLEGMVADVLRDDPAAVVEYLRKRIALSPGTALDLLEELAANPVARTAGVSGLARSLASGRSTLYEQLAVSALPPPEQCQFLFRALEVSRALHRGLSPSAAALAGGYAETASLRKALRSRLGVTLSEIRERPGWRWIVDRWIATHPVPS